MRLKRFLDEAFNINASADVMRLITSVIAKKIGEKFYKFGGEKNYGENYNKNSGDKGFGFRYITDSGKMFRFNWSSTKTSMTFTSVDVWYDLKSLNKPDKTIEFPVNMNIIQSIDKITKAFSMSSGEIELDESINEEEEKRGRGRPKGSRNKNSSVITVTAGSTENSTLTQDIKSAEKNLDDTKYANVDTIFTDIEDLTRMVAIGSQPSLLITGMPGIGKTFIVTNELKKYLGPEGDNWISVKGKTSTLGLYSTLFINREKLVVFDDCDSVFSNSDAINLLKGALDSYDVRTISWLSPMTINVSKMSKDERKDFFDDIEAKLSTDPSKVKFPSQFDFNGKIIFISNLPEKKIDSAIKSRSMVIDVTLKQQDVIKRIETILPYMGGNSSISVKKEVLSFLAEGIKKGTVKEVNMRTFILAMRIKESDSPRWQHLVSNYV